MENKEIRRRNLEVLVGEAPNHLLKEVAQKAGVNELYLSQIRSAKTRADMGDNVARKLERGHGKPVGWMDIPQWVRTPKNKTPPTPEEWALLDAYRDCPLEDQETIFDLCQKLRKK